MFQNHQWLYPLHTSPYQSRPTHVATCVLLIDTGYPCEDKQVCARHTLSSMVYSHVHEGRLEGMILDTPVKRGSYASRKGGSGRGARVLVKYHTKKEKVQPIYAGCTSPRPSEKFTMHWLGVCSFG